MPYIIQCLRDQAEPEIESIVHTLLELEGLVEISACTSVVIQEIITLACEPATGWRYHNLHRAYGVFMAAAKEANRRTMQLNLEFQAAYFLLDGFVSDIERLVAWVRMEDDDKRDGYLNYIVSEIAGRSLPSEYIAAVLISAGEDFYSEVIGPYEDVAIEKHGDISAYA